MRWTVMAAALALTACQAGAPAPASRPATVPTGSTPDARAHAAAMPAAYHEFQVFGDRTLYLSHYPMFSSIHAYQVILQAHLEGADGEDVTAAYRNFRRAHPGVGLSLSPAYPSADATPRRHDWVLPAEVHAGGRFNADLHWEADPEQFADMAARRYVARNVTVVIDRVLRFQMFYPDTARPVALSYLLFGAGDEWWLAHGLTVHPDFDQILRVTPEGGVPETVQPLELTVRGRPNAEDRRLRAGERVKSVTARGGRMTLRIDAEVGEEALERQG